MSDIYQTGNGSVYLYGGGIIDMPTIVPVTPAIPLTTVNVNGSAILFDWNDFGWNVDKILFAVVNRDAIKTIHILLETSEDMEFADTNTTEDTINPSSQWSYEVQNSLRRYWRATATVIGGGIVSVKFGVNTVNRYT